MKNLTFSVQKFDILKESNKSFLRGRMYAIKEGLCRKNIDFTLSSMEDAIPTVYNKPVLACFDKSENVFKGHDSNGLKKDKESEEIYEDYDQGFLDKNVEKAIGMIPGEKDSNVKIEEIDGVKWLAFDVLIWTKYNYKATKLLKKLGKEKISVEITVTEAEEKDDVFIIKKFFFDGVTVIGVKEGIEGAHININKFSLSDGFDEFQRAFNFAYEEGEKDNMKFDLKSMGINDFNNKVWKVLSQYKYTYKDGNSEYEYRKYYIQDIYPDDNTIILEDVEERKLYRVPFYINDDREVIIEINDKEEVEIVYYENTYKKKVDFSAHMVKAQAADNDKENKEKEKGIKMDIKFLERFVEKSYNPIHKFSDCVLFAKQDDDKLYKLDFNLIEQCEDEKFDELVTNIQVFEYSKEEKVAKVQFDQLVTEKAELEIKLSEKDVTLSEKEAKLAELNERCTALEKDLANEKEKCSNLEFAKFSVEAKKFVELIKTEFNADEDKFAETALDKIEKKEIKDMDALKKFSMEELFNKTVQKLDNKTITKSNLNPDPANVSQSNKKDDIFSRM